MDSERTPGETESSDDVKLTVVESDDRTRDDLPTGTVHCFPANPKQVLLRRVLSVLGALIGSAGATYFLMTDTPYYWLAFLFAVLFIVCALVFAQTFLIAGYRVAVDYEKKEVVLRYVFRKLKIPFEDFDCREGEPDKAQRALGKIRASANRPQRMYLILDNVHDEACYQTSSYDLASNSDFLKLKEEAEQISRVFKAREKYEAEIREEDESDETEAILGTETTRPETHEVEQEASETEAEVEDTETVFEKKEDESDQGSAAE